MSGRVEAIWVKRAARDSMDPVEEVALVAGKGIDGDASFGRTRRQVIVIEKETFERIRDSLPDAEPGMRRANFMLSGVSLANTRDLVLTLGGVRVRIGGEAKPCERMDQQCEGLTSALRSAWGGGVHGVVLDDGLVRVGDTASLASSYV